MAGKGGPSVHRTPNRINMATKKIASPGKAKGKTSVARRTMNPPLGDAPHRGSTGSRKAFQQHDLAGRLGGYEGRGNHARTGNRGHQ